MEKPHGLSPGRQLSPRGLQLSSNTWGLCLPGTFRVATTALLKAPHPLLVPGQGGEGSTLMLCSWSLQSVQEESAVPGAYENPQRSTQGEIPQGPWRIPVGQGDPCRGPSLARKSAKSLFHGPHCRVDERMSFVTITVPWCSWQGPVPRPLHHHCSTLAGARSHLSTFLLAAPSCCTQRTGCSRGSPAPSMLVSWAGLLPTPCQSHRQAEQLLLLCHGQHSSNPEGMCPQSLPSPKMTLQTCSHFENKPLSPQSCAYHLHSAL